MDTDDLSVEAYEAIMIEAENFNHDLTLQFGLLSDNCDDEQEFLKKSIQLIKDLKETKSEELEDVFFGDVPNLSDLNITLDKILSNIRKVMQILIEKRHFEQ